MLDTREEIGLTARSLAALLKKSYKDYKGGEWTEHVYGMLRNFSETSLKLDPEKCCFCGKTEFLLDFLTIEPEGSVLLAVESEQKTTYAADRQSLKHDFEKLLYFYSPLRLLVSKVKRLDEIGHIVEELTDYAHGCCQSFNPGAAFLLHFCLWDDGGPVNGDRLSRTWLWQSEGEPAKRNRETLAFECIES